MRQSTKRASLFGYGKVMQSLCKILAPCDIYDDSFESVSGDTHGNALKPSKHFNHADSRFEIVSPGIPPHSPLVKSAKNLISEYDYFYSTRKIPFSVWISGTNGKTTTTQMTESLLRDVGGYSGGNIGIPLGEIPENASIWILETSSFVLHYTNIAKPDIYALLPIAPDHLSWHGDMESYIAAKLKPLTMMKMDSHAIIPAQYADSPQATQCESKTHFYENALDLARIFSIDASKIQFKGPFLLDSILSLAIAKIITHRIEYDKLRNFRIGSHRIEEFYDNAGRLFVDDSKATNIDAVLEALKIYHDKRIYLILGGDNKGVSLEPLVSALKNYSVSVFAIGSCAAHVSELCKKVGIVCENCGELKIACEAIKKSLQKGEVCLLSPACASMDQFTSYKQRGEFFKLYAIS